MNTNIDRSVEESNKLFELAKKVIPGGGILLLEHLNPLEEIQYLLTKLKVRICMMLMAIVI